MSKKKKRAPGSEPVEPNKYLRLQKELTQTGEGSMTCFGTSMLPILKSGSTLLFRAQESYKKGDIVFCKVKGRFIDAHKIVAIDSQRGYQIANNHGHINGWTHTIYGRAVSARYRGEEKEF